MVDTQSRSKSGRKWMLILPLGCIVPFLVCCGLGGAIMANIFGMLKSSQPYREAVARAKASSAVQAAIGSPIEESFLVSGDIQLNNDAGHANLSIPLSGPKGSVDVHVVAKKSEGEWKYSKMQAVVRGGDTRIDLLDEVDAS